MAILMLPAFKYGNIRFTESLRMLKTLTFQFAFQIFSSKICFLFQKCVYICTLHYNIYENETRSEYAIGLSGRRFCPSDYATDSCDCPCKESRFMPEDSSRFLWSFHKFV